MDTLINNEDSDSEDNSEKSSVKPAIIAKPYFNVLLTKKGMNKLKNGNKTIFDLPLSDLREPPHIAEIYTIGDLVRFLDKHQYIKNAIEHHN